MKNSGRFIPSSDISPAAVYVSEDGFDSEKHCMRRWYGDLTVTVYQFRHRCRGSRSDKGAVVKDSIIMREYRHWSRKSG